MKRKLVLMSLMFLLCAPVFADEQMVVERELKTEIVPAFPQKERIVVSSFNDYGWVNQNSRVGNWKVFSNRISYALTDKITPYVESDILSRFSEEDYLAFAGAYFRFEDNSYLHSEFGFGSDIDYISIFQTTQEYGHKLTGNYYWQAGYKFLNYPENDVYIFYPGLIYYFGDHYISGFFNVSFTESRGSAQWGTLKGNFSFLSNRLNFWIGTAVGERLYDINLLKARKQFGYIAFVGAGYDIFKNVTLKLGYSYSSEDPDFMKRSVDFGCSVRF